MKEMEWTPGEIVRLAIGIALLVLISGVWACLWVPPL